MKAPFSFGAIILVDGSVMEYFVEIDKAFMIMIYGVRIVLNIGYRNVWCFSALTINNSFQQEKLHKWCRNCSPLSLSGVNIDMTLIVIKNAD